MIMCGIMSVSNIKHVVVHMLGECRTQICRTWDVRNYGLCNTFSLKRDVNGLEGCGGGCGGDVGCSGGGMEM